jgi:hypothetical protein
MPVGSRCMRKGGIDHSLAAALSTSVVAQPQPCGQRCSLSPTCWHGERTAVRLMLRGAAVSASWQWDGIGSFIDHLPMALQLGRSLTCIIRTGRDFTSPNRDASMRES